LDSLSGGNDHEDGDDGGGLEHEEFVVEMEDASDLQVKTCDQ
jgi:hypothetical protein